MTSNAYADSDGGTDAGSADKVEHRIWRAIIYPIYKKDGSFDSWTQNPSRATKFSSDTAVFEASPTIPSPLTGVDADAPTVAAWKTFSQSGDDIVGPHTGELKTGYPKLVPSNPAAQLYSALISPGVWLLGWSLDLSFDWEYND